MVALVLAFSFCAASACGNASAANVTATRTSVSWISQSTLFESHNVRSQLTRLKPALSSFRQKHPRNIRTKFV